MKESRHSEQTKYEEAVKVSYVKGDILFRYIRKGQVSKVKDMRRMTLQESQYLVRNTHM